jgi:hypothetical protein
MSQEFQVDDLFWKVASTFADKKKTFLTSGPQSRCDDLLKGGAVELVCIGDKAPLEGVKARSDYRERRISKDLIIDVSGEASLMVLGKLLKKHGTLVSAVNRDWAESFPLAYGVAWVAVEGGEDTDKGEIKEELDYVEESSEHALFWVAATHNIPSLPSIERVVPTHDQTQQRLDEAYTVIGELQKNLKRSERAKTSAQTHRLKTKGKLEELTVTHLEVTTKLDDLKKESRSLKRKVNKAEANLEAYQQLQDDHEALRLNHDELTTQLTQSAKDQATANTREKKLNAKLDQTRANLDTKKSESKALKSELTKSKRKLAIHIDTSELLAESKTAAEIANSSYQVVADAWLSWLGEGLSEVPARPPVSSVELTENWTQQLLSLRPMVTATLDEYRQISELQAAQVKAQEESERLKKERDAARAELDELRARSGAGDDTLRESLAAERQLRRAQERELDERNAQLVRYQDEVEQLRDNLDEMSRQSKSTISESSPRVLQLEAQVRAQGEQRKARERLMHVNYQLQLELTARLEEEIEARTLLSQRLESAEGELRTLRADRDFPQAEPTATPRKDSPQVAQIRPQKTARKKPDSRPVAERLSSLSDQLKRGANQRSQDVQAASKETTEQSPKLRKSSKQDQKRVRKQAKRLKEKHQASADRSAPPIAAAPVSAPSRPEMSSEERGEQAERARNILQDRLKKLGRRRRS